MALFMVGSVAYSCAMIPEETEIRITSMVSYSLYYWMIFLRTSGPCAQFVCRDCCVNTLQASSHCSGSYKAPMHKPIGIYMRGLILGVNA